MKNLYKGAVLLPLLLLTLTLSGCGEYDFLEDRIVGTWESYYRNSFESEERTLTFTSHNTWTLSVRYDDLFGVYTENDLGEYEIINGKLYLFSHIYYDEQVFDVKIRSNKLFLTDYDGYETVYRRY